jgi:zinc/manganese transport system substrate-binding protein
MNRLIVFLMTVVALAALPTQAAQATLNVLACEPEWAALTQELTGDKARITSATTAMQDPHRIEARPSLIARARAADLLVCTGAELEIGWLPLLQRESGNAKIQAGQPGWFEAAAFVTLIEKPAVLDRAMGDVHAAGNPHFHLDPRNLVKVADALARRLAELDPANAAHYAARHRDFSARMQAAVSRWEKEASGLRGVPVVVHHKNWSYLAQWLGLAVVADLEPKPGVDPSAAHLAQMLDKLKAQPAKMVLRAAYQSPRAAEWIAERGGMRAVELPYTVGGSPAARDLFALFDETLSRLKAAAQ